MDRNGFLPLSDIHPEYYQNEVEEPVRIQDVIHPGQEVLVQVVKEEIGSKGALLTTYLSLAGRDVVLMPGQSQRGISRKIEEEAQRERLRTILNDLRVPEEFGLIVRTAAENRTKKEIVKDFNHLMKIWEEVRKQVESAPAPSLIHKDQDLALKILRDYFNPNIKTILVDDREVLKTVKEFVRIISPAHERAVKLYKEEGPITSSSIWKTRSTRFSASGALEIGRLPVHRPNRSTGGHRCQIPGAPTATGCSKRWFSRSTGSGRRNCAPVASARSRRLIVIDFIDMRESRHAREVERRFKEEIKKDKAKITVGRISRFGLLELSRQHLGLNIMQGSFGECPLCHGADWSVDRNLALSNLRKIWHTLSTRKCPRSRPPSN